MADELDEYFEHARRDMFPKMKASALSVTILAEPDPKLCMELGAAILFDKPILVVAPPGMKVPLSLRTIAHKIIEDFAPTEAGMAKLKQAIDEVIEAGRFRGKAG